MFEIGPSLKRLPDAWRYALVGGLLSLPFTVASYAQTRSELSLSAVLVGGFLAGYLATRQTGESTGVGVRAGLVGALPVLWMLSDMFGTIRVLPNPVWFSAVLVAIALVVAVLAFGLAALGGMVGSRLGSWVAGGPQTPAPR
ncbi:hypothetical protein GJR96_09180 [Haloferax sp. MBLA0076]|uniref:DUF5518 domain-containing protein n=1 Tax=Haloferax litoreum TaxID=2666140 RepID=A0A6A8GJ17_9EURY|nr:MULTISPECIES: DUF5518 domain-containing protein [Haloferax]KAB1193609.1 hypothetical protein Hfx1148_09165 [Haloferax sp. CBA1148]MRX22127.1 hypothetical protein [Haloferax litoreum]